MADTVKGLVRRQTPEERELLQKWAKLASLRAEVAQRELDLATVQAELAAFERRYLSIVGVRYAELDELEAQIVEAITRLRPADQQAKQRATRARATASASQQTTSAAAKSEKPKPFEPSKRLQQLFRDVAKQIHPDYAADERERTRRTTLMAEANRAYQEQDEERLEAILREWHDSPESIAGDDIGAKLVRVIRQIAQLEDRLQVIAAELADLQQSELYQLKSKVEQAEAQGRDPLGEMTAYLSDEVDRLKAAIGDAAQRLEGALRVRHG